MRRTLLILLSSFLVTGAWAARKTGSYPGFKENKGQWHENVAFRTPLPNGILYLEKNGFTFDLYDREEMHSFRKSIHGETTLPEPSPSTIHFHAYKTQFIGTSGPASFLKNDRSITYYNYFQGKDPSQWVSGVRSFQEITYQDLYPGIDMRIYRPEGKDYSVKYDLTAHPSGNAHDIRLHYQGTESMRLNGEGHLLVRTSVDTITELAPEAWQMIDGEKRTVPCRYALKGDTLSFVFPEGYQKAHSLIIDPVLEFSTYSGSLSDNFGYTATYDSDGFLYSGSTAFGNQYPTTTGAYQRTWQGGTGDGSIPGTDIAISKYDTSGTFMVWSTLIGGESDELPHSLMANQDDEIFMLGTTSSPDYPVTPNAYDTSYAGGSDITLYGLGVRYINGSDIVVSRLSNDGRILQGSTFLGGTSNDGINSARNLRYNYADEVRGEVFVDDSNNCYIVSCTQSSDFPVTSGGFQTTYNGGGQEGCIIKLTNGLDSVQWSSFFGGSGQDAVYSVSTDRNGDLFVTGGTNSQDLHFPTDAIDTTYNGGRADAFLAKIDRNGQQILKNAYWGSPEYDQAYFVELNSQDNPHLLGQTEILDSTYIINAGYADTNSCQYITQFNNAMDSVIWSTTFGDKSGLINISPTAFLVDVCNKIYLAGWGGVVNDTWTLNNNTGNVIGMPITGNAYQSVSDGNDFYIMVLNDDASGVVYGSYMGGLQAAEHVDGGTSRFDKKGKIYQSVCAGCGGYSDFPIEPNPGAVSPTNQANTGNHCNNAVFKFDFGLPITVSDFKAPSTCISDTVQFINQSKSGNQFEWDFGDGDTSTAYEPTHQYDQPGTYNVKLVVYDSSTCNLKDSTIQEVEIQGDTTLMMPNDSICRGDSIPLGLTGADTLYHDYQWMPSTGLASPDQPSTLASPDTATQYTLFIDDGVCIDTLLQKLEVKDITLYATPDTFLCHPQDSINLTAYHEETCQSFVWSTDSALTDTLNTSPGDSTVHVSPDTTTTYYVKGTGFNGCQRLDSVRIEFTTLIESDPNVVICREDTVTLHAYAQDTSQPLTYDWSPDNKIISGDSTDQITVAPESNTTYEVKATHPIGCTWKKKSQVFISPLEDATVSATSENDTILSGQNTMLHATPDDESFDYQWWPEGSLSSPEEPHSFASPDTSTTYDLEVTDDGKCLKSARVTVHVHEVHCGPPDIFIPNAFTPNGDNENDVLYVRGNNIREMYFKVYTRWGEKVFETRDQDVGWDGNYKGKPMDPDVFVYHLEVTCVGGTTFFEKGNVTLIR